jgi:hypothetical protein
VVVLILGNLLFGADLLVLLGFQSLREIGLALLILIVESFLAEMQSQGVNAHLIFHIEAISRRFRCFTLMTSNQVMALLLPLQLMPMRFFAFCLDARRVSHALWTALFIFFFFFFMI